VAEISRQHLRWFHSLAKPEVCQLRVYKDLRLSIAMVMFDGC
jgi:hypothetical protein